LILTLAFPDASTADLERVVEDLKAAGISPESPDNGIAHKIYFD